MLHTNLLPHFSYCIYKVRKNDINEVDTFPTLKAYAYFIFSAVIFIWVSTRCPSLGCPFITSSTPISFAKPKASAIIVVGPLRPAVKDAQEASVAANAATTTNAVITSGTATSSASPTVSSPAGRASQSLQRLGALNRPPKANSLL